MALLSPAAILLDEVARSGSIRKAAERLNISASAVNRQILNLEHSVGLNLLERLPRGVRPTAAGERLLADVRRWRREQARTEGVLKDMRGVRRGLVTIGAVECFTTAFLPAAITEFQNAHPLVAIEVVIGSTDDLVRRLASDDLDMILCFNPPHRTTAEALYSSHFVPGIVMAADHPLTEKTSVNLGECQAYPFVIPDHSLALRGLLEGVLARAGVSPASVVTTNSVSLMKSLLIDSDRLGFLNGIDVATEVTDRRLTYRLVENEQIAGETLSLCVPRNRRASSQVEAFARTLKRFLPTGWPEPAAR